jgi:hypothetical protein
MIGVMFDSPSPIRSGSRHPRPQADEAVAEILRAAVHRRKRSAAILAVTGQLLADTRELLERCDIAMTRVRYPGRRRATKRSAALTRKRPRGDPPQR